MCFLVWPHGILLFGGCLFTVVGNSGHQQLKDECVKSLRAGKSVNEVKAMAVPWLAMHPSNCFLLPLF